MKPTTLLLSASLIANVAFVALLATRARDSAAPGPRSPTPATSATNPATSAEALRAALLAGDAAALQAAGISPDIARELALGRSFTRIAEKIRAAQSKRSEDERWWRARQGASSGSREQQLLARRELADALIAAFGSDLGLTAGDGSQFAFLGPEKRDALRRIMQDYDEMFAKYATGGIQLPSDRQKLRLLRDERDRDIAALLTPEEKLAYDLRTSPSANTVRTRYGDAIESEAEFQKLYALQKAFDEKYPRDALTGRISPDVLRERAVAERQLDAAMRTAVGDDRYAALRRAADIDVRNIESLANRLNLPPTTTDTVLASRDTFAAQSQKIAADASVPIPERRNQIQALATQAKAELARTLGGEAAEAYAERSPWLGMLQSGMAYSTTAPDDAHSTLFPGGSQSVYPVMPAGAMPAGAQRQFVINAAPPPDAPAGDALSGGGNVQVMSFSTSSTFDQTPAPGSGGARQIIVRPDQGATPPPSAAPAPSPRR